MADDAKRPHDFGAFVAYRFVRNPCEREYNQKAAKADKCLHCGSTNVEPLEW